MKSIHTIKIMINQVQFPGQIKARADYYSDGTPKIVVQSDAELARLDSLLTAMLGREPDMQDLFDYLWEAQLQ